MTSRLIPASRNATARTFRRLKFTFSTPVISHWTRRLMRSPHWSEPLSLLHVRSRRRGAPVDAARLRLEGRMKMTAKADSERFQSGADQYAVYLETPEGRLRSDLAFANLQDFLPRSQAEKSLCALDVGCGTGATAIRVARLGMHVTLLDSSPAMLDIANRAAREAGVTDKVVLQHGDATQVVNLFRAR